VQKKLSGVTAAPRHTSRSPSQPACVGCRSAYYPIA
jgi:hypothetical protein